jgi:hypothetical protein
MQFQVFRISGSLAIIKAVCIKYKIAEGTITIVLDGMAALHCTSSLPKSSLIPSRRII